MRRVGLWAGGSLVLAAALVGAAVMLTGPAVHQPLAFNHRVHLRDAGMTCPDCHAHALDGVRATIPNVEVCSGCHDKVQGDSPAEAAVVEHVRTGKPILWRKVYVVPDNVYFSHRRHTTLGGIKCETCHGAIGERTKPVARQLVRVAMNRCIACHLEKGATNDCVGCHR